MRVLAFFLVLGFALPAFAQWSYKDRNGRTVYTNDIYKLPKKDREKALAKIAARKKRAAEAKKAKALAEQKAEEAAAIAPRRPDPDEGGVGVKLQGADPEDPEKKRDRERAEARKKQEAAQTKKMQDRVDAIQAKLTAARKELDAANQQAINVPSGISYDRREKARKKVSNLQSELASAKARMRR